MGLAKTEIFTEDKNRIALFGKAIGHPARVSILLHLINTQECYCGDLVEEIGLAQSTVSQHLKALKELDLIKGEVEGTSVCYCINMEAWNSMKEEVSKFLDHDINFEENCC